MRTVNSFIITSVLTMAFAGCSSTWERNYVGVRDTESVASSSRVVIRSVPWERVQQTLQELESQVAASDVHPDDWTQEQKDQAKARLLKGLQIAEPPETVTVLGRSEFRTTDSIHPETDKGRAELEAFARQVGADMVVWSARSLGQAERVGQEPVTTYSSGTDWGRSDGRRRRPSSFSTTSTTWIPVRVTAEEVGFVSFFLQHGLERETK